MPVHITARPDYGRAQRYQKERHRCKLTLYSMVRTTEAVEVLVDCDFNFCSPSAPVCGKAIKCSKEGSH